MRNTREMSIEMALRAAFVIVLFISLAQVSVGKAVASSQGHTPLCPATCNFKNGYCGPDGKCVCFSGWQGANCDQCVTAVGCRHGACEMPGQCNCREGYGGRHCQLDMKYCERHQPCKNGALCTNDHSGSFICKCIPGFKGRTCSIREISIIHPSIVSRSAPQRLACLNGGTCAVQGQSSQCKKCTCPKGYTGKKCEIRVQMCVTRPCANGAVCVDLFGDYRCRCASGFSGRHCDEDRNECSILGEDACENGGQCVNLKGSYICKCREGFEGARCDKPIQRVQKSTSTTTPKPKGKQSGKSAFNVLVKKEDNFPIRVISGVQKSRPSKTSSTSIKVTHRVHEVELKSINVHFDSKFADTDDSDDSADQASVSVVQAVTFALLGVAFVLFVVIAGVVWLHQTKKRQNSSVCYPCYAQKMPNVKNTSDDNRNTVVVEDDSDVEVETSTAIDIYRSIPGKAVRTTAPSCERTSAPYLPPVDCLYVALPHDNSVRGSHISMPEHSCLLDSTQTS